MVKLICKETLIMTLIILFIVLTISMIFIMKNNNSEDEEIMRCIAENSEVYTSRTCSHCAEQEKILGEYLEIFNITECLANQEKCAENGITSVPTWIINGQFYPGVKSIEELKQLTGC